MKIIIMAGGTGSRLWPISRSSHPKQFLPLVDDKTMLQATLERVSTLTENSPLIICNDEHRFIAAEQSRAIGVSTDILLEPVGRNTAPAITLAAITTIENNEDELMLVLAADHVIKDVDHFCEQVQKAKDLAEKGSLVTFGIVPDCPETGYGYIRCGKSIGDGYVVNDFIEKPDLKTAQKYIRTGTYLWNSGMFLFKASSYLKQLETFEPEILSYCKEAINSASKDLDFIRIKKEIFSKCPDVSIDYAVMEKTNSAAVIPLQAGWSDVGAWSSLWDISDKNEQGNVLSGDVFEFETKNSYLKSTGRLVAAVGVENVVVVETDDAVLVADKDKVQDVKRIVEQLNKIDRSEANLHKQVYRPWGKYLSVAEGTRYQVKRITVEPGRKLSLQMHHHRAEHWVVVTGTAKVYKDDESILLTENESVYISPGVVHSLENPGKIPLELVEVQVGAYLGEDDIVRFEDLYGRS
ncbi:MAG: mannose-1-phosphate guanylyltransferase/mannose-6-phosphate isomerase [Neptuniibacter sp.]